ncbi:MAG: tetratricopeptide repeat protein [Ignavibacteriales bacterium]
MKNQNRSIVRDLKDLLDNYLTESYAKDFIKVLSDDTSVNQSNDQNISELDKMQILYEPSKGINYRIKVDKIITLCSKLLSEDKYFNLILDLSQLMFFSGEVSYSLEIAEDLQGKLQSNRKHSNLLADTYLMISKIHWSQANWEDCSYFISEAMRVFKSVEDKAGIAKCENMLGTLYGEKGEFDEAKVHLEKALELVGNKENLLSRAMILTNLGIICTVKNNYEKAIWYYKEAQEEFNMLKDVRRLSRVYHNLGMLYTRMKNYDAALDEFNKCITLSLENNYLSNCAVAYIGKAFIYTSLKNPGLADAYTDKAMELAYKLNDTLSIADIYKIKGIVQTEMNNFELSEELFENSIRLNKDIESKLNEAESSALLGELLVSRDKKEEAKPYLQTAANYFNGSNNEKFTSGLIEQSI